MYVIGILMHFGQIPLAGKGVPGLWSGCRDPREPGPVDILSPRGSKTEEHHSPHQTRSPALN